MHRILTRVLLCSFLAATLGAADTIPPEHLDFFEKRIRPLLADNCYECHSEESKKLKGDLLLDSKAGIERGGSSGAVVVPGDPEGSLLIKAVRHLDEDLQMPPKTKLSVTQIEDLVHWVRLGAPDPRTPTAKLSALNSARDHWAFQKPEPQSIPAVQDPSWPKTPIDHFILAKLDSNQLKPAPPANRRTLLRRASYDLTGLPPTAEEVEAFEADTSPGAFERVIERLLDSPHYGERWGRRWLDVARYADTKGYVYSDREEGQFVHSHVYRDWVVDAFNSDMPYDQFLLAQIAGDQVTESLSGKNSPVAGMGFLTVGRRFLGVTHDIIDDRIDTLTKATQGLTVSCARCHDHKFDPIPIEDYYSLYGVFAATTERTICLEPDPEKTPEYEEFKKGYDERVAKLQASFEKKKEELLTRLRQQTPQYLTAVLEADKLPTEEFYQIRGPEDLNPTIVRKWQAFLYQQGKDFDPVFAPWHTFARISKADFVAKADAEWHALTNAHSDKLNPIVLETFAAQRPNSMTEVAAAYGALLSNVNEKVMLPDETTGKRAPLSPEEEELAAVLRGPGSPINVPPGSVWDIEWFFEESARVEFGKLQSEIDRWIIKSPGAPSYAVTLEDRPGTKNPRVFKRGNPAMKGDEVPRQYLALLRGANRQPFRTGSGRLEMARAIISPDNPLTARVMVNRIWAGHFGEGLVKTMNDFGTRSEPPSHPELLDWLAIHFMENGWSIKKLHRLIMLSSVYQQRSDTEPGEAARQTDPENRLLWKMNRHRLEFEELRDSLLVASGEMDLQVGGKPVRLFDEKFATRRSIYGFIDRQFLPGVFRVFDFPNPDLPSGQRSLTTVPQQALYLMNNRFQVERARGLVKQVQQQADADPEKMIANLYRRVYQRDPAATEIKNSLAFIRGAEAFPLPEPPPSPPPTEWSYGFGEVSPDRKTVKFESLPHFTQKAWQGGPNWPDSKLGWVQLTAEGGHAGNDLQHAVIRRWTAPVDGKIAITAALEHRRSEGDGIHALLISSRQGLLGEWNLHNQKTRTDFEPVPITKGETLDFIADIRGALNNDDFHWAPQIKLLAGTESSSVRTEWDAMKDFSGPHKIPPTPLTPWEALAQALLMSNEFVFVD